MVERTNQGKIKANKAGKLLVYWHVFLHYFLNYTHRPRVSLESKEWLHGDFHSQVRKCLASFLKRTSLMGKDRQPGEYCTS